MKPSTLFASLSTNHLLERMRMPELPHELPQIATLNYNCSPQDFDLIFKIVSRGVEMGREYGVDVAFVVAAQDIATLHCNGTPLKLWQFLASDPADFSHDFTAIGRFIDRKTGRYNGIDTPLIFAELKQ